MNEIVIKETKGKAIRLSILGILMLAASIFVFCKGFIDFNVFYMTIGIVGTLFFGYAALYIIKRTLKVIKGNGDVFLLKINDEGITDYSSKAGIGLIRWQYVKSVKISRVFTEKFVSLELQDAEALFSKLPKNVQKYHKLNKALKLAPITLSVQNARTTNEELLEIIQSRLKISV